MCTKIRDIILHFSEKDFEKKLDFWSTICYNIITVRETLQVSGQAEKGGNMSKMNAKEFDLMISLILSMLKKGETEEVIKLLEEAKKKKSSD